MQPKIPPFLEMEAFDRLPLSIQRMTAHCDQNFCDVAFICLRDLKQGFTEQQIVANLTQRLTFNCCTARFDEGSNT
jgi:hypothetical protein